MYNNDVNGVQVVTELYQLWGLIALFNEWAIRKEDIRFYREKKTYKFSYKHFVNIKYTT